MQSALVFIGIGTLVALLVEAAFNLLAAHTPGNLLFTMFFYPIYLAAFYFLQKYAVFKVASWSHARLLLTYILGGVFGLAIEWFIIDNSPWRNPEALQWGMWVYWTAIVAIPTIYLHEQWLGRQILLYTVFLYGGLALLLAFALPSTIQLFVQPVWQTLFFTTLHIPYFLYLRSVETS